MIGFDSTLERSLLVGKKLELELVSKSGTEIELESESVGEGWSRLKGY